MKKKIHNCDFLIVGGGLIGCIAALALHKKKFQVLVLEKNSNYQDDRTLAVNANSQKFLSSLGLWKDFKNKPEKISQIIIKDYINKTPLIFENDQEPMGHVAFNREVLSNARNQITKKKIIFENYDVDIHNLLNTKTLEINQKKYKFKKIILCTGKNFELPSLIKKSTFKSKHKSYVGFFHHTKNHNNIAYEIFTKEGPLAVLPSPSLNQKKSTFIFSTHKNLENKDFKNIILNFFQNTHGQIKLNNKISDFNLFPHLSQSVDHEYILMGDILRSIHPVAGQGWNLGIKDIQTLCNLLDLKKITDEDFNQIYASRRAIESTSYLAFTSLINSLYDSDNRLANLIIKFGYQSLQNIGFLRKYFIQQAMGKINLIG